MNNSKCIVFYFVLFLISACSSTKRLPEGELLYIGAKIIVKDSTISKKERKILKANFASLVRPKPNKKFLGLRPKLFIYNSVGTVTKEKGFWYWLKFKVGEPPVLFSQVDMNYNKKVLQNFSENNGYFNTTTSADSTKINKKASVQYTITPRQQYKIKSVQFYNDSSVVAADIAQTRLKSVLKVGNPYSLEVIKAERNRIDGNLKEVGYFYFNADYLKVQVDSTVAKNQVDLIVKLKDETPAKAKNKYRINKIVVYPNFSVNNDSLSVKGDTAAIQYNDLTIIDREKLFKPKIFDRTLYFNKGDYYNRTNHNLSLNRLVNLGTFKFVKNQFKVADTLDNYLDAFYYLTPLDRKSIQVEVLAKTNSANYTGTELNINWSNRNTFRGAELLTISAFGGIEVQVSGQNNGFNVYRFGSEANLIWPRFIAPFKLNPSSGFVPKTKAMLGYEYQNRTQLYALQTLKAAFGYLWKENIRKEHQLNVTEITFASPQNVTALYQSQIELNPSLSKVIEKQLIFGPNYSYTYTNTAQSRKKNTFYFKSSIDLAGTIYGLASGSNVKKGDTTKIFGVPFSQFIKLETDFRHYYKIGANSQIASRIIVGAGYAYGNSTEMPFIKQFFIGGTNSLRAFQARSLGPGTYRQTNESTFLPDQSGDLKLELNAEYRAKIYSVVYGALFVDAGNIWLMSQNAAKPGSQFSTIFINEIAVGVGAGLRFDFNFLVLRTDLAFPIRKPYLPTGQRWVMGQLNFGDPAWRSQNLVFNLAIGYPF